MRVRIGIVLCALACVGTLSAAQSAVSDRSELWGVSQRLEAAVNQVARSATSWIAGQDTAQGVRIPGYGAVFVLSPRFLPDAQAARARALLRHRGIRGGREQHPALLEQEAALAQIEARLAARQKEIDLANRALERAMGEIERAMRVRTMGVAPVASEPPPSPQAPQPPAAPAPPAVAESPALPDLPEPPLAPWAFWFEDENDTDDVADRTPEAVVADVREAVAGALTSEARRLGALGGEEQVVVAVNFVPQALFSSRARPTKTLVMRTKKKDLEDRAAGRIDAAELRRRIQAIEY